METSKLPWIDNGNEIVSADNPNRGIGGFALDADNALCVEAVNKHEAAKALRAAAAAFWSDDDMRTEEEKSSALLAAILDFDNAGLSHGG